MDRTPLIAALLIAIVPGSAALAQSDRYELGQRLRALETELDRHNDPAERRRALAPLERATSLFFLGQSGEAGRQLDRARQALLAPFDAAPDQVWAEAHSFRPNRRWIDSESTHLAFTLAAFYPSRVAIPADARLHWTIGWPNHERAELAGDMPMTTVPMSSRLAWKQSKARSLSDGDLRLTLSIRRGDHVLTRSSLTLSRSGHLASRLERLRESSAALSNDPRATDRLTIRSLTALLGQLHDGKLLETDYPADRLLREAEAAVDAVAKKQTHYGRKQPGEFWLTLAVAESAQPVRLLAPRSVAKGEPLPLVIALHGAKGSENLWFDGYGRGKIASLCARRGWLLVAPRDGLAPGLIDAVDRLYPVDRRRVFLIGHSMGAAQAVAAACKHPDSFAGVAALGGGGPVTPSDMLPNVPFFVGIGAQDFLLAGARALRDRLAKASVKTVVYREYADVEHLMIVQLALGDVFEFFDRCAR